MKKIIALVCVVVCLLLFPSYCMADSTVSIDELGFSVSLPADTYVFTQNTSLSSSVWSAFDVEPSVFLDYLKSNNIYLDSIAPDASYEIVIIGRQNQNYSKIYNLNLYEDKEIMDLLSSSINSVGEGLGLKTESVSIYKTGDLKFYSFLGTQSTEGQDVYIKSYFTVVNGIFVQISLRSYAGSLSSQQERTIKQVVDSVHFKEILSKPATNGISISDSSILYKALIGGLTALIIAIPSALIRKAKKEKKEDADGRVQGIENKGKIEETQATDIEQAPIKQSEGYSISDATLDEANVNEARKYRQLLEEGIITQDEYDAKKKQLLGL